MIKGLEKRLQLLADGDRTACPNTAAVAHDIGDEKKNFKLAQDKFEVANTYFKTQLELLEPQMKIFEQFRSLMM